MHAITKQKCGIIAWMHENCNTDVRNYDMDAQNYEMDVQNYCMDVWNY